VIRAALVVAEGLGPFAVTFDDDPANGITAATWRLKPDLTHAFSLFDFADNLRARGPLSRLTPCPPTART
jgi:hypothetical protein